MKNGSYSDEFMAVNMMPAGLKANRAHMAKWGADIIAPGSTSSIALTSMNAVKLLIKHI